MAQEKLEKNSTSPVILTDTDKPTNAALKAQGWTVSTRPVTQPPNGDKAI